MAKMRPVGSSDPRIYSKNTISIHSWSLIRPVSSKLGCLHVISSKGGLVFKSDLTKVTMKSLIRANNAKSITHILLCALVVATCHATEQPIRSGDSIPSSQPISNGISSDQIKLNRKLMSVKKDWDPIWADEFDAFDSDKWSRVEGDGCSINLCGWGNEELVSAF
jgi:hypothetical protein